MKIAIKPGNYVLALSGGVDSVVLLDLLSKTNVEVVIAHFDHGIRNDSALDRKFCEKLAKNYNREFIYSEGKLGKQASEETARLARYKFLCQVKDRKNADGIITAHHQDDLIETAIINMLRGTSSKGLSSLKSTKEIYRPLLGFSKKQIITYAKENRLSWREDLSNNDTVYLRNMIRNKLGANLTDPDRQKLLEIIKNSKSANQKIKKLVGALLPEGLKITRKDFVVLPHAVAKELLAAWLVRLGLKIDKKTIERLVISLKTAKANSRIDINNNYYFSVKKEHVVVNKR